MRIFACVPLPSPMTRCSGVDPLVYVFMNEPPGKDADALTVGYGPRKRPEKNLSPRVAFWICGVRSWNSLLTSLSLHRRPLKTELFSRSMTAKTTVKIRQSFTSLNPTQQRSSSVIWNPFSDSSQKTCMAVVRSPKSIWKC